jgi:nucleotide-binding universal stress UspA family protein
MGAQVTLLHIYDQAPVLPGMVPDEFLASLREERVNASLARMEPYLERARSQYPALHVEPRVLPGIAEEAIALEAERAPEAWIVMGTLGANSLAETLSGSITTRVIARTERPLLAIPESCAFQPFKHLLYATHFGEDDLRVIRSLVPLVEAWDARISCLHVHDPVSSSTEPGPAFFQKIYALEQEHPRVSFHTIEDSDVSAGLQRFISTREPDLLVMLTHCPPGGSRALSSSQTRLMTLRTHIPLLAFHC